MGNVVTSALVRARKPKPSEPTDEWLGFTQLERQNSLGPVPVRLGNRTYLGWRENLNWEQGTERNSYFFVDMIY